MPSYGYECEACSHSFEETCSIADYKLRTKCPSCKKNKLFRTYSGIGAIINGNPTTVGKLAEENAKKLGKYGLEDKLLEEQSKRIDINRPLPAGMKRVKKTEKLGKEKIKRLKKIAGMTSEQKQKFIHEGKI